jgi:ABC-2 type transport system ATP-binding protein
MEETSRIITVAGLTKYYGSQCGVEDLTFSVHGGEIFGFLGPNGAGKTTCIRLLLDLLRPDSGRATVLGAEVNRMGWRYRENLGYLPADISWWPALSGRDLLDFFARFRQSGNLLREELLRTLDLPPDQLARKVRTYSRGTRRKLGLVAAMQHDPDLLILDEPTSGLDPLVRHSFFDLCRRFRLKGKTIFLSSHNLAETREICDRVAIIRDGRLAAVERLADLKAKSVRKVEVLFEEAPSPEWLHVPGVELISIEGRRALLSCEGSPSHLVDALAGKKLRDLTITPPDLEEFFLRHYRTAQGEEVKR